MQTHNHRAFTWLTIFTLLLSLFVGAQAQAQGARPTLANEGPQVQGGLKVGKNSVRSFVYNEQSSLPAPLAHPVKLPVYLIVTDPKGKETRYTTQTRRSTFPGGNPPAKEAVRWDNVDIPHPGKYILTVEIPKSDNPIAYNLSRRAGSVSKSFDVGGGKGGYDQAGGGTYDLIVKLKENRGTRGAGYWVYLKTPEGREIDKKRSTGNAQVTFKKVAALKKPYTIDVKAGNNLKASVQHRMPKKDDLLTIDLN
ncbi:MAG: hypothetical protein H6970_06780 [Gammaproteobacteria bacterium]|nr:hypothetical protein [Gammaproteobacteria bacterium]MCP5459206.1 hypothetical protein [Gammaproteobacteria bacterium]